MNLVSYALNGKNGKRFDGESETLIANCLDSHMGSGGPDDNAAQANHLVANTLRGEGHDASEDGTGRGVPLVPMAFQHKASAHQSMNPKTEVCDTLGTTKEMAVAYAIQEGAVHENLNIGPQGKGYQPDIGFTLEARSHVQAVAFTQNQCGDVLTGEIMHALATNGNATGRSSCNVHSAMGVRRLMPIECERLQGFDDGWTEGESDSARYRMLGNAVSPRHSEWIGKRIIEAMRKAE